MIVLDTNVLSELMRTNPSPRVMAWAASVPNDAVFTTAICEAELLFGLAVLPAGKRRNDLHRAMTAVLTTVLGGRVLPFDRAAARAFAVIAADRHRTGRTTHQADIQIAAIARARDADAVATRNLTDFVGCGVALINPWQAG